MFVRYMLAVQGSARQVRRILLLPQGMTVVVDRLMNTLVCEQKAVEEAKKVVAEGVRITENDEEKQKVLLSDQLFHSSIVVLDYSDDSLLRKTTTTGRYPTQASSRAA